jgi:hypothetical protein
MRLVEAALDELDVRRSEYALEDYAGERVMAMSASDFTSGGRRRRPRVQHEP